jgi:integrase
MKTLERTNLTKGRVDGFCCPEGKAQAFLWDAEVRGLAVRATPPGKRTPKGGRAFVFQGYLDGATPRITIGDTKIWTLEDARVEARRLQTLIDQGIDPRQEKVDRIAGAEAKRVADEHRETTVQDAWKAYLAANWESWGERHRATNMHVMSAGGIPRSPRGKRQGDGDLTLPGMMYSLAGLRLSDLTEDVFKSWMDKNNLRGKTQASNAFRQCRAFLNWCSERREYSGLVDEKALKSREVRAKVLRAQAKNDCLQREQLKLWFENVRAIENPFISAYLQITLLTGARPEEVECMKWSDIDFKWNCIEIHDKVEGERVIPLTPYASTLLLKLQRINNTPPPQFRILSGKKIENDLENWKPSKWVFQSKKSASGHIEEARHAHNRVIKAAGLPELSRHGLRRSFGTLADWVEVPAGIVAQIMGHKPSAIAEKHYRVRPLDLLRMWHTKIEAWILEQAGIEFKAQQATELHAVPSSAAA